MDHSDKCESCGLTWCKDEVTDNENLCIRCFLKLQILDLEDSDIDAYLESEK